MFRQPYRLVELIQRNAGSLKIRPDQKVVYLRNWDDEKQRLTGVGRLLQALVKLARSAHPEPEAALPPATPELVKPRATARR